MIIACLIISVLGLAIASVFGKKLWHKLLMILFVIAFIASLYLIVLNDKNHFGMTKTETSKTTVLVSSADSQSGPAMLLYQPLGDGKEKVYIYKTTKSDKLQKTDTENITNKVNKDSQKAQLSAKTTAWTYKKNWAKWMFGIAGNDRQFDHQVNTFKLPKEWLVVSVDQAKHLGTYLKEHQADIQVQAKQYVTEKVTALMMENPSLSPAEQKQAADKFSQEFQQQLIQKIIDGSVK